jgi:serine protease inhibitor
MPDLNPGVVASNALTARWVEAAGQHRGQFAVSGAGVWPLLAALAAGAEGPARAELEHAVGLAGDRALAAAADVIGAIDRAAGAKGALGLWLREDIRLRADWASALPSGTRGLLHGPPEKDQVAIDAWVKERTLGILDHMPARIDDETVLLLAACLAIQTRWETPFEVSDSPGSFQSGPWAGRRLRGLTATFEDLDRITVLDTRIGALTIFDSLGADDIDVHLVIGPEQSAPGAVLSEGIAALAGERPWRGGGDLHTGDTAPGLVVEEIETHDPSPPFIHIQTVAFEVTAGHDLLHRADLFGLGTAADASRGHFPGISDRPLAVQQARQSVRATFSAEGFEAASVTSMTMRLGLSLNPPPPHTVRVLRVVFDRPFGFLAVDRSSRLVLVAGWVENPAPPPHAEDFEPMRRSSSGR